MYIGCSHSVSADLQGAGRRLEQRAGFSRPESGQSAVRVFRFQKKKKTKKKGGNEKADIETGCSRFVREDERTD